MCSSSPLTARVALAVAANSAEGREAPVPETAEKKFGNGPEKARTQSNSASGGSNGPGRSRRRGWRHGAEPAHLRRTGDFPLQPEQVAVTEGAPATSPAHLNRLLLSTVGTLALYLPALHGFSSRASVFKLSQRIFAVSEGQLRSVIRTTGSSRAPSPPQESPILQLQGSDNIYKRKILCSSGGNQRELRFLRFRQNIHQRV
ncbi:hypothetical protein D4764_20G0001190 [Takifugu flavidus]|uniref:Uncharacterized protein n=1 Tax=Takifugu flavidus TaxID=433684 RepID=A0A5C6NKA7_9TELE|nr:hypothetical protein D4764_20G0001190 [Takifugu flavidus]